MFKKILIALVVLLVGFLAFVASRPSAFRISRSLKINAPAEAIFPLINDFHNWAQWSPYEKMDPNIKKTFSGPDSGVGANYKWAGDSKVGEGSMSITASQPSTRVEILLEFTKPMQATNTGEFTIVTTGTESDVTWAMTGEYNFMSKLFGVFVNMDQMVGGDFEKGLQQMKVVVETPMGAR